MELQSPLTQQARPDVFKPKVVQIYEELFENDRHEIPEGLWRELFLLNPDVAGLDRILSGLSGQDLVHREEATRGLFDRAIRLVRRGQAPADQRALDTLSVFLENVLNKRFANPSSDVIVVLAALDDIDAVFSEFVLALDLVVRNGQVARTRQKAVKTALTVVTGAYQTGLLSYFVNRDLFPGIIKLIREAGDHQRLVGPFVLLGLLANYNKFEFQNPYQLRIADYVDDNVMTHLVVRLAQVFAEARDRYLELQPDQDVTWSVGNAISYISLGLYKPAKGAITTTSSLTEEQAKAALAEMPPAAMTVLLPLYDFVNSNKHFCLVFVTAEAAEATAETSPFGAFLSAASYTLHNAHRTTRAALYSCLSLLILRIMVEDAAVVKALCSPESSTRVRLCRQRQPLLPVVQNARPLAASLLDVSVDAVNHNLRRKLDTELYVLVLALQLRLITYLGRSRTRLQYHWAELWRSLLSFVRFLHQNVESLGGLGRIERVAALTTQVLALALSTGENFLPDAKSHDDLIYKLIESADALEKFRDAYGLAKGAAAGHISALTNVSRHYSEILRDKVDSHNKNISPREITKLIKQGQDSLTIQFTVGLDHWDVYREADHRNLLKRLARTVVQDARALSIPDE